MPRFQILPTEVKFFDWFNKGADNALAGARLLHQLLADYTSVESRVSQITEVEHRGDFIVHETMDLLRKTFITPLEGDDIRHLISAMDDVVDYIEAAADALLLYKVERPIPEAVQLSAMLLQMTEQLSRAIPLIADKKTLGQVQPCVVEVNRLENEADRLLRVALGRLVEERGDWFELFRWKEILQLIEDATDRCEDVADVLQAVVQKNA